ncbi:MAG: rod shape-determining protein [Cytophagales bacterium]|jgi:rod shape-determining protein MreB|nr:rod shape-determining protein [Cytophagales bacterium]
MRLLDFFLRDTIGIDPGSQHLRIIKDGKLVFNEPSKISIDTNQITGLGNSTRLTEKDVTIKPVDCAIADFHGFEMLLRGAMKKGFESTSIIPKSCKIYFCIPTNTTEIEKRAYRDSAEHAGAVEVYMVYQSCCAAIGLNTLFTQKNFIIVDFGSSKIEITVFANSLIISTGFVRMGTDKIYRLVKNHIRRRHNLHLSDRDVEFLLDALKENLKVLQIQEVSIKADEIRELLSHFFYLVNDELVDIVERISKHNDINKILTNGIYFTGGGSLNNFLREQIKIGDQFKRTFSSNPLLDNINGLKKILSERDKYKSYILV